MSNSPEIPVAENWQTEFNKVSSVVEAEFQVEESTLINGVPTYYLKQPQETKQAFLRLLENLDKLGLIAFLRRSGDRIVLRIAPKPPVKPSNVLINWLLFFATIATTFVTGYFLSEEFVESGALPSPIVGGVAFSVAIMAVLGVHEMGHKLTADKSGIEATPPYFIPGPPPVFGIFGIGTFGAVIMQKSLPRNRDALFDVGASGPLTGFFLATITFIIGIFMSAYTWIPAGSATLPAPLLFTLVGDFVQPLGAVPPYPSSAAPGAYFLGIHLHPIAFAGWVGMIVTMLNLLPAAMLDGGHIARSLVGETARLVLTGLSIAFLFLGGFVPMALFVLFMAMYRHPGPLDDVSALSRSRKVLSVVLVAVFVLSSYIHYLVFALLRFLGW
ncbi:site-2 protease family protein [Candidatus Bathyarchaeota archaeon]|nr:site-2 protease family protein [Candidatus Bathyarchaeota archaeon]